MKKLLLLIPVFISFVVIFAPLARAQDLSVPSETFYRATVETISNYGELQVNSVSYPFQDVKVKIDNGDLKGQEIAIEYGKNISLTKSQLLKPGDSVVIVRSVDRDDHPVFQIIDKYRLNSVIPFIGFFFVIVLLLSQWKGLGSIVGMIISLAVILKFIVPRILAGQNPLLISIVGCLMIMVTTIYLAHGFSDKITIAVFSTFLTLVGIGLLSALFVEITSLSGLGSEDASSLRFGATAGIDFRGLLLGGILIGALGVLDDVTTGLSVSVFELAKANPKLKFNRLFASGLAIGKEHIASLVNTLVLAYAGSALPIFLMIFLNVNHYPAWLILNDGIIIEEIARTLAGSIGLVAAVPLTTFISAYYLSKIKHT